MKRQNLNRKKVRETVKIPGSSITATSTILFIPLEG